ncbi:g4570 [Coccomyxa viridis]|uniref:G4570 protein n=1 Tax=Coccomyxa viridis TaxID=1274662 RepID=A0ABP1FS47_9CHLO
MAPKAKPSRAAGPELHRGIGREGRSKTYKRRGLWAIKKKNGGKFPVHEKKEKAAEPESKGPRFYPADDVKKPLRRRGAPKAAKLRASLTPGTVVILLAGRFKGKRAIFLKQLESGLLLVTGPFVVNGVPLKRVNQAYVIATSTKVELKGSDVSKLEDSHFKAADKPKEKKGEEGFFKKDTEPEEKELSKEYIERQKTVDEALVKALSPELKGYLGARFTLHAGDRPHLMKF